MKVHLILFVLFFSHSLVAQTELTKALLNDTAIDDDLQELCDQIGGRVTGSESNIASVEWAYSKFNEMGVSVEKMEFEMPALWLEAYTECSIKGAHGDFKPQMVAKYMSPAGTYLDELIFVGFGRAADYDTLSIGDVKGKIILVESDLCLDIDGLFSEYGHSAEVETEAIKRGVKAIVFMASRPTKLLYRFITANGVDNTLPQVVMAREDAQRTMRRIMDGESLKIELEINTTEGGPFKSYNVIAEIPGSEFPDEVIIIGAHLDSWALGTGANDNGCNVSMMIDIARQMHRLQIKPKRTIRFALWNGEEQGYFGSWAYNEREKKNLNKHRMAMSVDIGSGAITGFFTNGRGELIPVLDQCLAPVNNIRDFNHLNIPIVGTDNFDFMLQGIPNLVAIHKPATYGVNYHASSDTYDKVDIQTLKSNAAIVAQLTLAYANLAPSTIPPRSTRVEMEQLFLEHNLEFTMRMFNVWEPWASGNRGLSKE